MSRFRSHLRLLAGVSALLPAAAFAQAAPPPDSAVTPAPVAKATGTKRVYTPADFARFAPKTAYDMLVQVPSFTIHEVDTTERGLGQASENVLINGQRVANKSGGAVDELQRTPASSVERIEIVDAASLGIAGLSGQVANVIVKLEKKSGGQFEWHPDFRPHFSKPNLFRGSVSYTGTTGPVEYTLSIKDQAGRGAFGGDVFIYDRDGVLTERRKEVYHSESDLVTFGTQLKVDGPGSSVGNLFVGYTPYWNPVHRSDDRFPISGDNHHRTTIDKLDGWYYDVNADYEFALGPGRLKLIGVQHRDHEPLIETQITRFDSGAPDEGTRFVRNSHIGETIGRGEYHWKGGKNDWQFSFERAFNFLDQKGGLFTLGDDGEFHEVPFPGGTGRVTEVRYEALGTWSRSWEPDLDMQLAAGAEVSRLDRTDDDQPARKFFRPKGSLSLAWRPSDGWDLSLKVRRRVGQISFYDFLSQPKLADDRQNAGNPDLVPPQKWEFETEVGRELGRWGKTRLRAYYYSIQDIVDIIPLKDHTEGVGNLPHAVRWGFESTSTFQLDPLGWTGAKVDVLAGIEHSSVRDPLTGKKRPITYLQNRWVDVNLRHDIPHTDFAWGAEFSYTYFTKNYYLTEVSTNWEGPWFASAYVEDKDVFGLTVRAQVGNFLNARHIWNRTVYVDWRDRSPVDYVQRERELIGPIFSLSVKGTF